MVKDMESKDQKMWGDRHCREDEGSKVEMIWTRNRRDEGELVRDIIE